MNRSMSLVAVAAIVLGISPRIAIAGEMPNYSGKYLQEQSKKEASTLPDSILEVTQTEDAVVITQEIYGKKVTAHCPFNGSDGDYTSPGGILGKCKARLDQKSLTVESFLIAHTPSKETVRMHSKERWQLSKDGKTLTIRTDTDFPDFPGGVTSAVGDLTSSTRKYARVDNP